MALQSSGQISLKNIADEFGDTAPHSLSEFYGADSNIPSSGAIDISNFYGASDLPDIQLVDTITYSTNSYGINNVGYPVNYSALSKQSGDILIIIHSQDAGDEYYSTSEAGWQLIGGGDNAVFTRRYTSGSFTYLQDPGEANYNGAYISGIVASVRNASLIEIKRSTSRYNGPRCPGFTNVQAGDVIVIGFCVDDQVNLPSAPSGFTLWATSKNGVLNSGSSSGIAYKKYTSAVADTGSFSWSTPWTTTEPVQQVSFLFRKASPTTMTSTITTVAV